MQLTRFRTLRISGELDFSRVLEVSYNEQQLALQFVVRIGSVRVSPLFGQVLYSAMMKRNSCPRL